jgi:hypothetical protein
MPMWIIQTVLGVLLSGGIAWTTWASVTAWKHDTRIGIVETKVDDIHGDISEIKDGQKAILLKLDKMTDDSRESERRMYRQPRLYGR